MSIIIGTLLACYSLYFIICFDEIFYEPGVVHILSPSPYFFYIPIFTLSVLSIFSGICLITKRVIAYELYFFLFISQSVFGSYYCFTWGLSIPETPIILLFFTPIFGLLLFNKKSIKEYFSKSIILIIFKSLIYLSSSILLVLNFV
jgi:hypothetical protein